MNENKTQSVPFDVEVKDLGKTFVDFWHRPKVEAVRGVSFNIARGEVFGLLGPNGSGKSTTIKMLLGLLKPSRGDITVLGHSPRGVKVKRDIGYLPEETYLHRFLSARETLLFHGRLYGLSGGELRTRTDQLLEMVGLRHAADRPLSEMSKGMMRRVGIAQALINDPQLLILDEPTSGLDPIGRRQVKDLIIALGARQKTILLSSHLLAEVEDVCTSIAILLHGRIHAEGRVDALLGGADALTLSARATDEAQAEAISAMLRKSFNVTTERRDAAIRLESYFMDVILRAQAERGAATGADSTMALAPFLSSGPGDSP